MIRTGGIKYIEHRNATGSLIGREYYNLTNDQAENISLLGDANIANDPPASTLTNLRTRLNAFATCTGASCLQ